MNTKYLGGIAITLALVFGLVGTFKHQTVTVVQPVKTEFGGTSPDIASPYVDFGGVRHWYYTSNLSQSSTTVCSFQAPVATSTLVYASVTLTTGTTTPLVVDIGKSSSPSATTTLFASATLGSGALGTLLASTTQQGAGTIFDPVSVFAAATATSTTSTGVPVADYTGKLYLNFKYGGPNGSLNSLVGMCKAEFIQNI